ncbi:DUF3941 domain-containing protein [Peribacillus sp. B-H-3]
MSVKSNPATKDDNKLPEDHNARNREKNIQEQYNKEKGRHSYSKKTDHL